MSASVPEQWSFYYVGSGVEFEIRYADNASIVLSRIVLAIQGLVCFHINFTFFLCEECHCNFKDFFLIVCVFMRT